MTASFDLVLAGGRAAWPSISLDPSALAAHVERHERDGEAIVAEHAGDFYLACACADGIPAASRALDDILRRELVKAVARIDSNQSFVDEVLQLLRVKLLMDVPPKIADYSGRAPLRRWLATAAVRTALNLRRGREHESVDTLESTLGQQVARGPELSIAADKYRDAFAEGLRIGIATLTDRERALLRMNLVEQMGVDKLSRVYGCGRSTVARWLQAAREKLLDALHAHMNVAHGLTKTEAASLAVVVRGELDVSIARLLGPPRSE